MARSKRSTAPLGAEPYVRKKWPALVALGLIALGAFVVLWQTLDIGSGRVQGPVATERRTNETPAVDFDLLAQVRDGTPAERLRMEPRALEHLLLVAPALAPEVLAAMGLREDTPLATIVQDPARWRGRPVAVRGTLLQLGMQPEPHPQPGRAVWSGQLRAADGRVVLFKMVEPPDDAQAGGQVLLSGLFFMLRDESLTGQGPITEAPLVVGRALVPVWPDWQPVVTPDPAILARARDEDLAEQQLLQRLPLYHLADWVRRAGDAPAELRSLGQPEWVRLMEGAPDLPRGSGFRIPGQVVRVEEFAAEANPLGLRTWSRVWLWSPSAAATLCVLVPRALPVQHQQEPVVVAGWFLKRIAYEQRPGAALVTTCLFVAAGVRAETADSDPRLLRYTALTVLVIVLMLMTFLLLGGGSQRRRAADALVGRLTRSAEEAGP